MIINAFWYLLSKNCYFIFSLWKYSQHIYFIGLRKSYKWLKFVYTWKGTIWYEKSPPYADAVMSRAFSSTEFMLFIDSVFIRVVGLWVAFQCNLNHPIWRSVEEIMAKIWKLCKVEKSHPFDSAPLCLLDTASPYHKSAHCADLAQA